MGLQLPAALAVFAVLAGCTSPAGGGGPGDQVGSDAGFVHRAGDACGGIYTSAGSYCASASAMLECRSTDPTIPGTLREIPCRGPAGCLSDGSKILCDNATHVREGDACMLSEEGSGTCSDDAGVRFRCSDGGFVGTRCDGGCSSAGSAVSCAP